MTTPIDQAWLKAEMGALAKVYVGVSAMIADCAVHTAENPRYWKNIRACCLAAQYSIHKAGDELAIAHNLLREQP